MTWQVPAPQPASISRSRVSFCLRRGSGGHGQSRGPCLRLGGKRAGAVEADAALWGHSTPASDTPPAWAPSLQTDGPAAGTGKGGALLWQRQMEKGGGGLTCPKGPASGDRGKLVSAHKSRLRGAGRGPGPRTTGAGAADSVPASRPALRGSGEGARTRRTGQEEQERRGPARLSWAGGTPSPVLGEVMSEEVIGCQLNRLLGGDKGQVHGGSCGHIV